MAYIYPAPGVANVECTLAITSAVGLTGNLLIPALQDITLNNSNDVFTWTQLDEGDKLQVATTATNSLTMNVVLDKDVFFGLNPTTGGSVGNVGLFGLSKNKNLVSFSLYMGDTDSGATGPTITGNAYITGLAPTVSADAPVWVSPLTLTVTGSYTASV
jgi:hypothetical protein